MHPFARVLSHKRKSLTKSSTPTRNRLNSPGQHVAINFLSNNHRQNDLFHLHEYSDKSPARTSGPELISQTEDDDDITPRKQIIEPTTKNSGVKTDHKENTPDVELIEEDKNDFIFFPPNPTSRPAVEPAALDPNDPRCYFYIEPSKPNPVLERSRLNVERILAKRTEQPVPSPVRDEIVPIPRGDLMAGLVFYVDPSADISKKFIKGLKHPTAVAHHLKKMGATIKKTLCNSVTHVLFNNGGRSVYEFATRRKLEIVGIAWIEKCKAMNKILPASECPAPNIDLFKDPEYKKRPNLTDDEKEYRRGKIANNQEIAEIRLHEVALKTLKAEELDDWKVIQKCFDIHSKENFAGPHRAMRRSMHTVLTPHKLDINICKAIIQKHELEQQQQSVVPVKKSKKSLGKVLSFEKHSQSDTSSSFDNSLIDLSIDDDKAATDDDTFDKEATDDDTFDKESEKIFFFPPPPPPVVRKRHRSDEQIFFLPSDKKRYVDTEPVIRDILAPPAKKIRLDLPSTTPSKNSTTPSKNSTTPSKNSTTLSKNSTTPRKTSTTLSKNVITPRKTSTTLSKNSTTPRKTSTTPRKTSDTLSKNSTTPRKTSDTLSKNSTTPSKTTTSTSLSKNANLTTPSKNTPSSHSKNATSATSTSLNKTVTSTPLSKNSTTPRKTSTSTPVSVNSTPLTKTTTSSTKTKKKLSKPSREPNSRKRKNSNQESDTTQQAKRAKTETKNLSDSFSMFAKPTEKVSSQPKPLPAIKLCFTGLDNDKQKKLMLAIRKLGECKIYHDVEPDVTHVICSTARDTSPTLNVLKGILNNCWVLSFRWVQASVKKGKWENESRFVHPRYAAAMKVLKQENAIPFTKCSLLHLIGTIYVHVGLSRVHDYQTLVRLAGGQVSHDFESADIIVGPKEIKFKINHKCKVSTSWLIDTICAMKVKPFNNYLL